MDKERRIGVGKNPPQQEIKYSDAGYKPTESKDPLKANAKKNKKK